MNQSECGHKHNVGIERNYIWCPDCGAIRNIDRDIWSLPAHSNKVKELQTVLSAWHEAFGTTQLTHALCRLEEAEQKAHSGLREIEEKEQKELDRHIQNWLLNSGFNNIVVQEGVYVSDVVFQYHCAHFGTYRLAAEEKDIYISNVTEKPQYIHQHKERLPLPEGVDLNPEAPSDSPECREAITQEAIENTLLIVRYGVNHKFTPQEIKQARKEAQAISKLMEKL